MIEVVQLAKQYASRLAVADISLTVPPGTICGLVGPNGAGKTTTLKAIAGLLRPTEGCVTVAGHNVVTDPLAAKQALGYVPDEPALFDDLTAAEHLALAARLWQVPDGLEYGLALLRQFDLHDRRDDFPDTFSRGMRQKLAIACALLHRPSALVLDEPLTGLDPRAMATMRETIRTVAQAGTAVLLSSHLLPLVEQLCDRMVIVMHGRVVAAGTMAEVQAAAAAAGDVSLEAFVLRLTAEPA